MAKGPEALHRSGANSERRSQHHNRDRLCFDGIANLESIKAHARALRSNHNLHNRTPKLNHARTQRQAAAAPRGCGRGPLPGTSPLHVLIEWCGAGWMEGCGQRLVSGGPRPEQNSIWEERPLIEDGVVPQGASKRPHHGHGRPPNPQHADPHTRNTVLRRSVRSTDPSISACTPNEQAPAAVATKAAMSSLSEPAYLSRPYKDIPKVRPMWVLFPREWIDRCGRVGLVCGGLFGPCVAPHGASGFDSITRPLYIYT